MGRGCGRDGLASSRDEADGGVGREGSVMCVKIEGTDIDDGCDDKVSLTVCVLVMFKFLAACCVTLCLPTAMPTGMGCPELPFVFGTSSKIGF